MKINPNQTRGLDRILDKQIGTGTTIISEGAGVRLLPGEKDQILISQSGNRLQLLVNGSEKFLLSERESQNFEILGDPKYVTIDPSVSLYSLSKNAVPGEAKSQPSVGSAEGGQLLGHLRRAESAYEGAVTQKTIAGELKEDAFINHIGKQMQSLLSQMGASPLQAAFRTEKDLLPFLKQMENISGKGVTGQNFPANFMHELNRTVQKTHQQISAGAQVDLEFLGLQITKGLRHSAAKAPAGIEMHPGKIPFEAHLIPAGESLHGAFQKWGLMNEAISKSDTGMMRMFAQDPSFMKMALPVEKGAFIDTLSRRSPELSEAERMLNSQSIIQILYSSQNTQEFREMMIGREPNQIFDGMKNASAEFNIAAHLFQSGDLALDPNQPSFLSNPYLNGFTQEQILAGRQQLFFESQHSLQTGEFAARFSENPLLLAIASPDEKASLIRGLQGGYVSAQDNRSIINILQSAIDKTEFDQIVDSSGGKAIGLALQDPSSQLQWNRLAGAYDRIDLTTDFVEGIKNTGAFLEPFPFGNDAASLLPLKATPIFRDQLAGDVSGILNTFMTSAYGWIGNQIGVMDRSSHVHAALENWNRMLGELPLLNVPQVRNQLNAILQQPNIQPEQILIQFENLASATGLSPFDLRNLITQPLAFAYQTAAGESGKLAHDALAFLQENLQLSTFQYGPGSPHARLLEGQIQSAQKTFLPFADRLQSVSNLLSDAFPPPADLISGLTEFTSAFGANFAQNLLGAFPNFSDVVSRISLNAQSIARLVYGDRQIRLSAPPATDSPLLQLTSRLTSVLEGLELIRSGDLTRKFSKLAQDLVQVSDVQRDLVQMAKQTSTFFASIQDGSFAKNLQDVASVLKEHNDPVAELTKATAEDGAKFLTQLRDGSLAKIQQEFLQQLNVFQNSPGAEKINQFFESISSVTAEMIGGHGSEKLIDDAVGLMSAAAYGEVRGAITDIVKAGAAFRSSPAFRTLIDTMERGAKFLSAMNQGTFPQNMDLINSRFGYTPAVAHVIERGLHLATTGATALKVLTGREYERPVSQLTRKSEAKTQAAKEVDEALTIFPAASTFFNAVTDVENMDLLWGYHRQLDHLKDEVLIDSSVRRFEKQAQSLAAGPDVRTSIENQFTSFRKLNSR